jgi:acetyltransferase-like isoleucine patch superfamily enzyme
MTYTIITADPILLSILKLDSKIKSQACEFIDLEAKDGFNYEVTMLERGEKDYYLFGNANFHNHSRLSLFSSILNVGIRPDHFISDRALVAENASVGMATVVYPNAVIDEDVKIGFNAMVMPNATINKGAKVANNVYIGSGAVIGAHASIAANAYVGDGVRVSENVKIGKNVIIKDATLVTKDVPDGTIIDSYIGEYVRIFN